ncbi:MAG TPA: cytochrome c [Terriglobales bacterium]|nr:cytochrome c [Terriglobales bacterium]
MSQECGAGWFGGPLRHRGVAALIPLALLLSGCRLDMHVQPKVTPLRQSDFFSDGRGSRPLVEGTVARGDLRADTYFYSGMVGKDPGTEMPFPVTREVLDRGRERFNIYCSPCHSIVGDGNGVIVQRGYRRPTSYYDSKLLNSPIGHFYDVMTNGFGAMPDYAAQVSPRDRWAIAAYIRALQLSQHAPASAIPPGTSMAAPPAEGSPASSAGGGEGKQP